jgi:TRAP-type C4-dicarboxylate transport system permease small subunit
MGGPDKRVFVEGQVARSKWQAVNAGLVRINRGCIGIMLCAMFLMVFANVVTRYCLGFSIAAAEEISTFLMIWVTYLGAGLALREGRLASIDVLQDRLPAKLRSLLRTGLGMVMVVFFLLLSWYGVGLVVLGWSQETFALMIPRGIPYLVVPIGSLLFVAHSIFFFRKWVRKDWDRNLAEVHPDTGEINRE